MKKKYCTWSEDYIDDYWYSDCNNQYVFTDGGPKDNGFIYCPYCGRKLRQKKNTRL